MSTDRDAEQLRDARELAESLRLPLVLPFEASDRFLASMDDYWARHPKPAKPRPVKKPPLPGKMRKPKH